MFVPPANIVGGNSVPLGRPVVPEVYSRLGRGTIESGGSMSRLAANQSSQSTTSSEAGQFHPTTMGTPAARCDDTAIDGFGSDEQNSSIGVFEDVCGLVGGEVEVDRHRRRPRQEAAEMRQRGLGRILGVHRDALRITELGGGIAIEQGLRAPVQRRADLAPGECAKAVDEREAKRVLGGSRRCERRHLRFPVRRDVSPRARRWRRARGRARRTGTRPRQDRNRCPTTPRSTRRRGCRWRSRRVAS